MRPTVAEVLWFVQILFREKSMSPLANKQSESESEPYLLSHFLVVLSWILTFNMPTKASRVWDVALGFLAIFLSTAGSDLRVNLLLQRFVVFNFWIISLTVEWWTWNCLEMAYITMQIPAHTHWWSVNQVLLINSTWLLLTVLIATKALRVHFIFHTLPDFWLSFH